MEKTIRDQRYYLSAFRQGQENALAFFYERFYKPLLWYGRGLLQDEFTVSCIVQEAFVKVWDYRENIMSVKHLYCFLRQEITWKIYAWCRNPRNRFIRQWVRDGETEQYSDDFARYDAEDLAFKMAYDEECHQLLMNAIGFLPPKYRNLMDLYLKHGVNYRQLSMRMGTSDQKVAKEMKRALEKIKSIINVQKTMDKTPPCVMILMTRSFRANCWSSSDYAMNSG